MKWMIAGILALSASAASADSYMTFSNGGDTQEVGTYKTPGGCDAPRPPEVEDRRVQGVSALRFLESAYIHQVAAGIEGADGECSCELRYPAWDAALKELEDRFIHLPDTGSSAWVRDYARTDRSRLTREVNNLCRGQGVR
ncbi:hypothetical protein [Paracoccus beibuensis]|uniref:hypothetical protein n=1 Tax=Paracoccus beibuensis TaxID=547602 RepID=UPI00223E9F0D|nr:hypothetical protein [Paracoccus beibuensis]